MTGRPDSASRRRARNRRAAVFFALLAATAFVSCGAPRSKVRLAARDGHALSLRALTPSARAGLLSRSGEIAAFSLNPARAGLVSRKDRKSKAPSSETERALTVTVSCDSPDPVDLSFVAITGSVLDKAGESGSSGFPETCFADGPVAVAEGVSGEVTLGLCVPVNGNGEAAEGREIRGFAVSVSGSASARARVLSAAVGAPVSRWSFGKNRLSFVPSAGGGRINAPELASGFLPRALVPRDSYATLDFAPSGGGAGELENQRRASFRSGHSSFAVRVSPARRRAFVPSFVLAGSGEGDGSVFLAPDSGCDGLIGVSVTHGSPLPVADRSSPTSPILADPSLIVEWPRDRWRNRDFEVFSWDCFPTVLIFDTADYAAQDRLFKRLAFFVEKEGYRGKLLSDAELEGLHAYNAHDYRAESLAAFFDAAAASAFPLGKSELELRDILVREGIVVARKKGFAPGAGAVLSISRESVSYLRYLFMAHEGYHGIYFVDPDFRAEVSRVYRSMDARAIEYLQGYFAAVDTLGYDTGDSYLMENEFMAYLMQQPLDRVGPYFAGVIAERYLRHGGRAELAEYVRKTGAADFVRAATELNEYAFARWGLAGGRVGLFVPE
jgi:hypothetical protein